LPVLVNLVKPCLVDNHGASIQSKLRILFGPLYHSMKKRKTNRLGTTLLF